MSKNESAVLLKAAVQGALEKKAESVVSIALKDLTSFTDHFLICHGNNSKHNQAIADSITEHVRNAGFSLRGKEGCNQAEWILIDYVDIIIHIFNKEKREFFDLEGLWSDAPLTKYNEEADS